MSIVYIRPANRENPTEAVVDECMDFFHGDDITFPGVSSMLAWLVHNAVFNLRVSTEQTFFSW